MHSIIVAGTALFAIASAGAVTHEQVISREHPAYDNRPAIMTAGRDGNLYFSSRPEYNGYVIRIALDGSGKSGASLGAAGVMASANANGQIGVARQHFQRTLAVLDPHFRQMAANGNFQHYTHEFGAGGGYNAPAWVEAGEHDFYGVDQFFDVIRRIDTAGKQVAEYALPRDPEYPKADVRGLTWSFRVDEKHERFIVRSRLTDRLRAIGFDGTALWMAKTDVSGGFDVGPDGTVYTLAADGKTVRKFDTTGQPAGEIALQWDEEAPYRVTALRMVNNAFIVKRTHPTELFVRFDAGSGVQVARQEIDYERLAAEFPAGTWTAGRSVPFRIEYSGPARNREVPQWRVWARPLGTLAYQPLALQDGTLEVPEDLGGIYQIKISPEIAPVQWGAPPDYLLQAWVEIRRDGSVGTVNVMTPENRTAYGRGEAIPFTVLARTTGEAPVEATVRLSDGQRTLAQTTATLTPGTAASHRIPASLTSALTPGRYQLIAEVPEFTPVSQPLVVGPGVAESPFLTIQYGDYNSFFPQNATVWDAADRVAGRARYTQRLGFNTVIERQGFGNNHWHLEAQRIHGPMKPLRDRLAADPLAVAPDKTLVSMPLLQTLAAYSAQGTRQMGILLNNDATLPLGTAHEARSREQLIADVLKVTPVFESYPTFRGWSWGANWWTVGIPAQADEKAALEAAAKAARETGTWSPILDTHFNRTFNMIAELTAELGEALRKPSPALKTALAGPYRHGHAYPPLTFAHVDEVDLQSQFEQISIPYHAPFAVDYYRRPGKPSWGHPELWADSGTGEQVLPTLWQMVARGTHGVGFSGEIPHWPEFFPRGDPRAPIAGLPSVFRALNTTLREYGPWLAALQGDDEVAIVVSGRMIRLDGWANTTFQAAFEAWLTCQFAQYPAAIVFAEDATPETLRQYRALIVVNQRVEMEPNLAVALDAARAAGVTLYRDETSRPEMTPGTVPLGIAFDTLGRAASSVGGHDVYFSRFLRVATGKAAALKMALSPELPSWAQTGDGDVWVSRRKGEDGRFVFAVNAGISELDYSALRRVGMASATQRPLSTTLSLRDKAPAMYDVFAMRRISPENSALPLDLTAQPARLYALLPAPIGGVQLQAPSALQAGQRFAWTVRVLDEAQKPLSALVPVHLRLMNADGDVLQEVYFASGTDGIAGQWRAAINSDGAHTLVARELISGQTARIALAVAPAALPLPLELELPDATVAASAHSTATPAMNTPEGTALARFGAHLRDVALADDGGTAVFNAMNWGDNLIALDTANGKVRWRNAVGGHFAYAPQAWSGGVAVQGFDFDTHEGYHLYLADAAGQFARRFALYGLPRPLDNGALTHALYGSVINHFAVAPDASWVAASGDLGLVVFDRDGEELWSRDGWQEARRNPSPRVLALDANTLLLADGNMLRALSVRDGREIWRADIPAQPFRIVRSGDGSQLALLSGHNAGTVTLLKRGETNQFTVRRSFSAPGVTDADLSYDGALLALTVNNHLQLHSTKGGQLWTLPGDDKLHSPRLSPDASRVAASSELGTVYVASRDGNVLLERDMDALCTVAWLPGGDLLLGNWMGTVVRLSPDFTERWRTRVEPGEAASSPIPVPTARRAIGNAAETVAPLSSNLLEQIPVRIEFYAGMNRPQVVENVQTLFDGNLAVSPQQPTGWDASPSIIMDTMRSRIRLTGITLAEDPAHPLDWLVDGTLESWDAATGAWQSVQPLLATQAVRTYLLEEPVITSRLRIVSAHSTRARWRLTEIALHGEVLGGSHPDIVAERPVAVLLDEDTGIVGGMQGQLIPRWRQDEAFTGQGSLEVPADINRWVLPGHNAVYGENVFANWDFSIKEHPQPGEYRYLQFAWRALSPETTGAALHIGPRAMDGLLLLTGERSRVRLNAAVVKDLGDAPPPEQWRTVRVDLWKVFEGAPPPIRSLVFSSIGGPTAFDRIVLARSEADLDHEPSTPEKTLIPAQE